jgi:hypothetical protein
MFRGTLESFTKAMAMAHQIHTYTELRLPTMAAMRSLNSSVDSTGRFIGSLICYFVIAMWTAKVGRNPGP